MCSPARTRSAECKLVKVDEHPLPATGMLSRQSEPVVDIYISRCLISATMEQVAHAGDQNPIRGSERLARIAQS